MTQLEHFTHANGEAALLRWGFAYVGSTKYIANRMPAGILVVAAPSRSTHQFVTFFHTYLTWQ